MLKIILILASGLWLLLILQGTRGQFTSNAHEPTWMFDHLIPDGYDRNQVPLPAIGRLLVNGTLNITSFSANKQQMGLKTDLMLCLRWRDERLIPFDTNRTPIRINEQFSRFWLPKVYFRNALSSSIVTNIHRNQYLDIWPETKMVDWCSRMNVEFQCHFELSNFPFDAQDCRFELETFKTSRQNLWLELQIIDVPQSNYQFRVHHHYNGTCRPQNLDPFTRVAIPEWSTCVYGAIRIVRHLNYYIIRYYLTTYLILVIGFVQFWIPTIAWPGRLVFTVVLWLFLQGVSLTAYDEVPAHDTVSLFWWIWTVQFFDYMGLIEFAVALAWVQFAQDKQRAHAANRESPDGHYFGKNGWYGACATGTTAFLHKLFGPLDFFADEHGRNKVDYFARFLFPLAMFVFVIVYILATVPNWAVRYRQY